MTQEEIESYMIEEIDQYSKIVKLRKDCLSLIPVLNLVVKKLDVILAKRHYSEFCIFYQTIWDQVRLYYKKAEKLVPVVLYMFFKIKCIKISPNKIIEVSNLTKKQFKIYFLEAVRYCPEYQERNRQEYITHKILEITESFKLGMPFFYQSKKIMHKLWEQIKNTKDDVIAGLVTSISALCSYKEVVNIFSICNRLGIRMSTIQFQVKRRIFEQLHIDGFVSLVRSSDLLKEVMRNLGLLEAKEKVIDSQNQIVQIILGNANQVFNHHNGTDYYFFAVRDVQNNPVLMMLKVHHPLMSLEPIKRSEAQRSELFTIEHLGFFKGKDPPLCEA